MPTQILMPMGGLGSRFSKQGYTLPKPLIEVDGKPMFLRALESFNTLADPVFIFVLRKEQVEQYSLDKQILAHLPEAKISILDHDTRGAVETCMIAKEDIDDATPIIIADCDIYFESSEYFSKIRSTNADGLLLTFNSDHPRYSYVEVGESGHAIKTAEKVVISNHAILGGYFFKSGLLFKKIAEEFLAASLPEGLKEYYVSHLFNIILAQNGIVEIANVDVMHIFGTPEELNSYLEKSKKIT